MKNNIEIKDGYMYGGWRAPENRWTNLTTSIHDDGVAHKVGMRGGTIPGTIHLDIFPPLLLKLFGDKWFEKGSLSLYYTFATTDKEKVRAVIAMPTDEAQDMQLNARIETPDGKIVAKGTVSVGEPKELSYLQNIKLKNSKPEDLRILAQFQPGYEFKSKEIIITQKNIEDGLRFSSVPLDYYRGNSTWGVGILSPTAMTTTMRLGFRLLATDNLKAVSFYGATEVRNINGPVKVGVPYKISGKMICVGVSSKTEYFWYDSILEEKESGKQIASMRHMNRFMKATSPHYTKS